MRTDRFLKDSEPREHAFRLLENYFELFTQWHGRRPDPDNRQEWRELIDNIIQAAVLELAERIQEMTRPTVIETERGRRSDRTGPEQIEALKDSADIAAAMADWRTKLLIRGEVITDKEVEAALDVLFKKGIIKINF